MDSKNLTQAIIDLSKEVFLRNSQFWYQSRKETFKNWSVFSAPQLGKLMDRMGWTLEDFRSLLITNDPRVDPQLIRKPI